MQKVLYSYPLTQNQKLFVEKVLELSHPRSLDSYRVKATCPTYMMTEFYSVLDEFRTGKMKYLETFMVFKDELVSVLEKDYLLDYRRMSKEYFLGLLRSMNDDFKTRETINEVEHALYFLLTTNADYKEKLFDRLISLIKLGVVPCEKCVKNGEQQDCVGCKIVCSYEIENLSGTLTSELLNHGWSKLYIHKYVKAKFTQALDFDKCWEDFKDEFNASKNKELIVVFKLHSAADKLLKINYDELKPELSELHLQSYEKVIKNDKIANWLKPYNTYRFMLVRTEAFDYEQAMKIAKTRLSSWLDLLYLGYSDTRVDADNFVLLYNEASPKGANLHPIHYSIDGYFKSNTLVYNQLRKKVALISSRNFIAPEVKDKIETAIRYLRVGSEALELEQKFLNYWIGLENIFSSNKPNERTFNRIVSNFITAHSISYSKRNVTEFYKDIKRMGMLAHLGISDISQLEQVEAYNKLINMQNDYPLLSQRARWLKSVYFKSSEDRKIYLGKHAKNLERNLVRMYRVRNQLVHEAAIMQNIESITGSLRYYLTFILNKLIDFYSDCKEKPIKTNLIGMEDFFIHQELVWENIKKKGFIFSELMQVPHSVEFIS